MYVVMMFPEGYGTQYDAGRLCEVSSGEKWRSTSATKRPCDYKYKLHCDNSKTNGTIKLRTQKGSLLHDVT